MAPRTTAESWTNKLPTAWGFEDATPSPGPPPGEGGVFIAGIDAGIGELVTVSYIWEGQEYRGGLGDVNIISGGELIILPEGGIRSNSIYMTANDLGVIQSYIESIDNITVYVDTNTYEELQEVGMLGMVFPGLLPGGSVVIVSIYSEQEGALETPIEIRHEGGTIEYNLIIQGA